MVCVSCDDHHAADAYYTYGHHHQGGRLYSHFGPYQHNSSHSHLDHTYTHHGQEHDESHTSYALSPHHHTHPPIYQFVGHGNAAVNKRRHPRHARGHSHKTAFPPHHNDVTCHSHSLSLLPHEDHCPGSTLYAPHVPYRATLVPPSMPGYAPRYVSKRCGVCSRCHGHDEMDMYCGDSHQDHRVTKTWSCDERYQPRMRGF